MPWHGAIPAIAGAANLAGHIGGGGGQPGPGQPGAPAIPDGIYPMGYQNFVKGVAHPAPLTVHQGDWNFATMGYDLSGYEIHGKVVWPAASGTGALVGGDGFKIVGADAGTTASALLDCNRHFTQTRPTFQHFTIAPTVSVIGLNGLMGDEFTIFDFDIAYTSDGLSPNNLNNGGAPLNINGDWGLVRDLAWSKNDNGSHPDGSHNDDCQVPGGTIMNLSRIYMTGLSSPTRLDGQYLRTHGPVAASGGLPANTPRPQGQINSCIQTTQLVSHVGSIVLDRMRFGGGVVASLNLSAKGSTTKLGPITVTNSLFDGNAVRGYDIIADSSSPGTNLIQSGNKRIDGSAIHVNLNG